MCSDALIGGSIGKLGVDLYKELFDVAKKVAGKGGEELLADGILVVSFDDAGDDVSEGDRLRGKRNLLNQIRAAEYNVAKPGHHSHAQVCEVLACSLGLLQRGVAPGVLSRQTKLPLL